MKTLKDKIYYPIKQGVIKSKDVAQAIKELLKRGEAEDTNIIVLTKSDFNEVMGDFEQKGSDGK